MIEHVLVTPMRAREWLATQAVEVAPGRKNNRILRAAHVAVLADCIRRGQWDPDDLGEPIMFDEAGHLRNGQHRLHACIITETPLRMRVEFHATASQIALCDSMRKVRTLADSVRQMGIRSHTLIAAAVRWYWNLSERPGRAPDTRTVPQMTALALVENPVLQEWTNRISVWRGGAMGMPGVSAMVALGALWSERGIDSAAFFEPVITGLQLMPESPAARLRHRLMNKSARVEYSETAALIIKAFRAFHRHLPIGTLKWSVRGPESYPDWREV